MAIEIHLYGATIVLARIFGPEMIG